jgi:prolyl 4-hydroxylase
MPPTIADAKALARAGRDAEAVALIRQLSQRGDPEALFLHGEMCWRGGLVEQDLALARDLYRRAGESGHPRGHIYFTNLLASGIAGIRDWPQALARLAKEAVSDPARKRAHGLIASMSLDANGDPVSIPEAEVLSERPHVRLVRGFVSPAECQHIIAVAEPHYQPSMVFDADHQWVEDPIRTSDGSTIHWLMEDPAVHAINRRVAAVTGTAYECGETLQALRYAPGQQYRPHFDFVPGDNQRIWTALLYLNDDYQGGETAFVQTGLKVRGALGDALVFFNATGNGELDPQTEHAGLPVLKGAKYLATRWIREKRWIP